MGMYMYVSEQDRETKRKVVDKDVDEAFQEALKCDSTLMIEQSSYKIRNRWFEKSKTVESFQIFHESPAYDNSAYQARYQLSGSGEKRIVIAYLHGIINGCIHKIEK